MYVVCKFETLLLDHITNSKIWSKSVLTVSPKYSVRYIRILLLVKYIIFSSSRSIHVRESFNNVEQSVTTIL
jgi:hypothetical protein